MSDEDVVVFRLYVAGDLPNSRRSIANLDAFCREFLPNRHRVEIVDVFEAPERALTDRVLLTPQLVVHHGRNKRIVVGDLADHNILSQAANVAGSAP